MADRTSKTDKTAVADKMKEKMDRLKKLHLLRTAGKFTFRFL